MAVRRLLGAGAALAVLLIGAGCGTEPHTGRAASPTTSASATTAPVEHLSLARLEQRVLGAVRRETSVHLAIGNLNPPPVAQVVQDYSRSDGDLEASFAVAPGRPPAVVGRRVDGDVFVSVDGKHFEQVPTGRLSEGGDGALAGLLRTDALKDLTALLGAATSSAYDGTDAAVGSGAARYRLAIDTATWFAAQGGHAALGVPRGSGLPASVPATLWVARTGLPVRLELRHGDPLDGAPGTGTTRIDYSRWSEPVRIERPKA